MCRYSPLIIYCPWIPNPYQTADGIAYVIVNGTMIVRNGELVPGTYPGKEILSGLALSKAKSE